ncbi:MAG: 2-oxoglutarate synthase [Chloroflexi bacterium CG_4_9_14_3_um_filter_45_9]|nr:MAG: 2-oxoglutarate synthase [Chloroflexi bacterium CG_4_8_14_3_um_filter_45_15]PJB49509.1 MAG: 2-oxoglutarate synthase [Chloroflexi bacterium CG_4_9_14_3_um_filter_45_9]
MDDLATYAENTWCPGCGNFGILNAFKKAVKKLEEKGIGRERIIMCTGIGCHGKIFDYVRLSGFYSIHGRSMATAQGIKLANPDLKVIAFAGDGDAYGEGIDHLIFAAKRNAAITVIVHDNGAYSLTLGQYTPTSDKGFKGPSTPRGSIEEPLNPLVLMLAAGATFVARDYPVKLDHLVDIIVQAVEHEGFAFIDVLQPCVSFNNTYQKYNQLVEILDRIPGSYEEAMAVARKKDKLPIGILYRVEEPVYHKELYGDWNPITKRLSQKDRRERIAKLFQPK